MKFYAYHIMIRQNGVNWILQYRQLFHQFVVDMYAKIEAERLLYIRLNQRTLRSEEYIHLRDAMAVDGNTNNLGQVVILPATFTGKYVLSISKIQDMYFKYCEVQNLMREVQLEYIVAKIVPSMKTNSVASIVS